MAFALGFVRRIVGHFGIFCVPSRSKLASPSVPLLSWTGQERERNYSRAAMTFPLATLNLLACPSLRRGPTEKKASLAKPGHLPAEHDQLPLCAKTSLLRLLCSSDSGVIPSEPGNKRKPFLRGTFALAPSRKASVLKSTYSLPPSDDSGEPAKFSLLKTLGPGLITGASDDDPSGIGTYAQTGAQFGYATGWTLVFSYPLMAAVQIISARLGRTTGHGVAGNLCKFAPRWLAYAVIFLLLVANTINLGADVGAMADASRLLIGGPETPYVIGFGTACILAQVFFDYETYVRVLKWLTLVLFAYIATLFFIKIDLSAFLRGLVVPQIRWDDSYLTAVVAIFGTTISPYLFFWQASQEVQEIKENDDRQPLDEAPSQAPAANRRINIDTLVGMGISNVIGLAIMTTAAATLNANGKTDIQSSADAARALEPIAGSAAELIFALGIIGTGLLAVPVLASSAAYAIGEALGWPIGLDRKFYDARAFYATIAVATAVGVGITFTPVNPIEALFWSAVINGIIAVPVLVLMIMMASDRRLMKKQTIGRTLKWLGWTTTIVMGLTAIAMGSSFW